MATYNIGGIIPFNRVKDIDEALLKALSGDEVNWMRNNKWTHTLTINHGIKLTGSSGRLKIKEHQVGLVCEGSGVLKLENLNIEVDSLANAILLNWGGQVDFINCSIVYSKKAKADKCYPTIIAENNKNLRVTFTDCTVEGVDLDVNQVDLKSSHLSASKRKSVFNTTYFSVAASNLESSTISSTEISLSNISLDGVISLISETSSLESVTVGQFENTSLTVSGDSSFTDCQLSPISSLRLSRGVVDFKDTVLDSPLISTDEVDIRIHEGVEDNANWDKVDTTVSNLTESELVKHDKTLSSSEQLREMVGLKSVKETMGKYMAMARVSRAREKNGLSGLDYSLHLTFSGNPGTGKTTVAEIFAKGLYEEGVLPTAKVHKVGRSDLVADIIGGTAIKTKGELEKALGGVLFIDEAYSLTSSGDRDFADEAVNTIVEFIDGHRNDLVVILAGYTNEMKHFFDVSNPGLRSRFTNWVEFDDYSIPELKKIQRKNILSQYPNTEEGALILADKAIDVFDRDGLISGNARFVRNLVQEYSFANSVRVRNEGELSQVAISTLTTKDINGGYKVLYKGLINSK